MPTGCRLRSPSITGLSHVPHSSTEAARLQGCTGGIKWGGLGLTFSHETPSQLSPIPLLRIKTKEGGYLLTDCPGKEGSDTPTEEDTVTMTVPCHPKPSKPQHKCLISPNLGDALELTNISPKMERAWELRGYRSFTSKDKPASSGRPPPTPGNRRLQGSIREAKREARPRGRPGQGLGLGPGSGRGTQTTRPRSLVGPTSASARDVARAEPDTHQLLGSEPEGLPVADVGQQREVACA